MTNCYRCHNPILDGQELHEADEHKVCKIEWDKRYDAKLCVTCGDNAVEWRPDALSFHLCNKHTASSLFEGYLGT